MFLQIRKVFKKGIQITAMQILNGGKEINTRTKVNQHLAILTDIFPAKLKDCIN